MQISLTLLKSKWTLAIAFGAAMANSISANGLVGKVQSPSDVVQKYCQLDQEGARLSSQNPYVNQIFTLVTWPDEPGWGSVVVSKKCAVVRTKIGQATADVTVRYTVVGELSEANVASTKRRTEFVTFALRKVGTVWKIERPLIPPHVAVHVAIIALGSLLKNEKDPQREKSIRTAIVTLKETLILLCGRSVT